MKPMAGIVAEAPAVAELGRLEAVIRKAAASYRDVGKALRAIRDQDLYQPAGYDSFEDYCLDRWEMDRHYACRVIQASEVAEDLLPMGNGPTNERQARVLVPLSAEDRRTVWKQAQEAQERITAALLERLVEELAGPAIAAASRVQELGAKALAGLSADQKVEVIREREKAIRRESPAADKAAQVLDRIARLLGRARKLCGQLGPEGDRLDERIEKAIEAVRKAA